MRFAPIERAVYPVSEPLPTDTGQIRWWVALALWLIAFVAILAVMAPANEVVQSTPDSAGYFSVADRLASGDLTALAANRAALFPAVLALYKGLHSNYFLTIQYLNLLGLAVLLWRLLVYRMGWPALATGLLGTALLVSELQYGYSTLYLREGLLPGVTALHLALLLEAFRCQRGLFYRLLLTLLALLLVYHLKGLYLFSFMVVAPLWCWALIRRSHTTKGWRAVALAGVITAVMIPTVWLSNPNNDSNLRGITLLGVLIGSNIPALATNNPAPLASNKPALALLGQLYVYQRTEWGGRKSGPPLDPFLLIKRYRQQMGGDLAAEGMPLFRAVLLAYPNHMASILWQKTRWAARRFFIERPAGILERFWGASGGVPSVWLKPLSLLVFGTWLMLPLAAPGIALWRRRISPELAAGSTVLAVGLGMVLLVGIVGYTDFPRLFLAGFEYGLLALPAGVWMMVAAPR